jgi:hypothetical protein
VFQDPFDWGLNDFSTKSLTKSLVPVFCFLDQAKNGAANEIVTVIAAPIKAFQKTKENRQHGIDIEESLDLPKDFYVISLPYF